MVAQTFMLPDLGEGLTEAVIVSWLVSVGDTIAIDQAIAEVETAKSVVELPSPFAGVVLALHGNEGEAILTGAPVIEVGASTDIKTGEGEDQRPPVADELTNPHRGAEAEAYRNEERAGTGSGNVLIGYGTGSVAAKGRRRRKVAARPVAEPAKSAHVQMPATQAAPAAQVVQAAPASQAPQIADDKQPQRTVAVRSPLVRRLAKELGVDVRAVPATGNDGAITRADVQRAAETAAGAPAATPAGGSTAKSAAAGAEVTGLHGLRLLEAAKMSPLRKAISAKLGRSRAEIPEATVWVDVDFTELWNLRKQTVAEGERPPSVTTFVARVVLLALQEYPLLASRLSDDGNELLTFDGVNLGIAVDSERGLTVPVLPRADELTVSELDAALRDVSAEARTGKLAPARLSGSTFTFNNYGGFGVDGSAAIINHPEVAILGMGRVIERPWVVDGEIVVRRIAQISLAFDHRVCDGGYTSGFLGRIVEMIEHPLRVFPRI